MKTGSRRSHDLSFLLAASMLGLAMLACNLRAQSNSPDQGTPTKGSGQATPTSTQPGGEAQADCLAGIFPGTTTRDKVVALLGEPAGTDKSAGVEVLFYPSPVGGVFNSISLQNETVAMLSVILGENNLLKWSTIQEEYGEPIHTTYSNYLQGSMTYIYPDQGLAFVAARGPDVVFIRECFVPMALADYMSTWGSSLPTEDPFTQ
jgi:hypothetical protein